MIYDNETLLSDGQAITVSAPSTNKYDCGPVRDIGRGQEHYLSVRVDETVTADGAATVTIKLETADDEALASPIVLETSRAIPKVELLQGQDVFVTAVPPGSRRYLRCYYEVTTGPLTAGKFTANLGPRQRDDSGKHYPRAAVARA